MKNNTFTWIGVILVFLIGGAVGLFLTKTFIPKSTQINADTIKIPFDTTAFVAKLKPIIVQNYRDTGSIKWKDNNILVPFQIPFTQDDTLKILHAYFEIEPGKDTIVNNPDLFFELKYKITQNKLIGADGRYFWKKPQTIINNNSIHPLKSQVYIGTSFGANLTDGFMAQGRITLKTEKDVLWGLGINFIPGLSKKPMFFISRDFKIKLGK